MIVALNLIHHLQNFKILPALFVGSLASNFWNPNAFKLESVFDYFKVRCLAHQIDKVNMIQIILGTLFVHSLFAKYQSYKKFFKSQLFKGLNVSFSDIYSIELKKLVRAIDDWASLQYASELVTTFAGSTDLASVIISSQHFINKEKKLNQHKYNDNNKNQSDRK